MRTVRCSSQIPWNVRSRRAAVVMGLGAVAVHELRFLLAYDGDGSRMLDHDGHPYLALVSPMVALLLVWLAARSIRSPRSSWLRIIGGLLGVYVAQALVEGVIAPGELTGLGGVLGHGGWVALPLAVAVGWLVARAARLLHDRLARLVPRACRRFGCHLVPLMAAVELALVRSAVLARNLAGRAPPAQLV